ncbi:MAG TPA: hemolysin family protein [Candidatus Acidoferrales bacterium]
MNTILIIVAVSLVGSFLCSLFEASLYAITPTRVEVLRRRGLLGAKKLAALRTRIDEPIAAILTVNTITHTMGATWAGALVGEIYGNVWVTWFAVGFTIAILFVTEIIPKTLGVSYAGKLAPLSAWPIQLMIWTVWPLAWLSVKLTERLTRRAKHAGPGEEEILVMADLALQAGKLLPEEPVWVRNALRLDKVTARDLMTPRPVVESLRADVTLGELLPRAAQLVHSRLPVTEGDELDQVIGVVHRREIFDRLAAGDRDTKIRDLMRPVGFYPENVAANQLLRDLMAKRQHLAMVVSEHGHILGLITLEDILESLLGSEIVDEYDREVDMQDAARRRAHRPPRD